MGLSFDPGKLIEDTTDEILRVVFEYFPEDHLSAYDHQQFRRRIRYWLENKLDIGEERFEVAFSEGENKGYDNGRDEAVRDIRRGLQDFLDELGD